MADYSLGIVRTSSITTGVRATNNQSVPATRYPAQSYSMQALSANTGSVYICSTDTPNLTTGVGVLYEVPAPSSGGATDRPLLSVSHPYAPDGFDLSKIYILPAVSNEGVRVTAIR